MNMDICDRKGLKRATTAALGQAVYDPKKLVLIHTAASMILALVLSAVSHVLQEQIAQTGGLSGVGMRTVLETVQEVLLLGQLVAVVFWQIGYCFAALRLSDGQPARPGTLLEGFRRFGPVLRLRLLMMLMYMGLSILGMYVACMIFGATPWASPIMEAYEIGTEEAMLAAMEAIVLPLSIMCLLAAVVFLVPSYYRLRMADYALMENPKAGALSAIRTSRGMMRGKRLQLLKLDLSFWWFYALEVLVMVVAYGDTILAGCGVTLPWSSEVSFYVFLIAGYICQLALYWWRGNEVQVTYAMAYRSLLPQEATE